MGTLPESLCDSRRRHVAASLDGCRWIAVEPVQQSLSISPFLTCLRACWLMARVSVCVVSVFICMPCLVGSVEERIVQRAQKKLFLDSMVNRGSTAQVGGRVDGWEEWRVGPSCSSSIACLVLSPHARLEIVLWRLAIGGVVCRGAYWCTL